MKCYLTYGADGSYVYIWINKNPGMTQTDPAYPPVHQRYIVASMFEFLDNPTFKNAKIEIKQ